MSWSVVHDTMFSVHGLNCAVFLGISEQVTVLRGHTGLVKGLAWDPVGKYLASQSDDRSVRVWRTCDWQQDARITEPFQEVLTYLLMHEAICIINMH